MLPHDASAACAPRTAPVERASLSDSDASVNPRARGFTLIEVILVTALFAMVITVSYQILIETLESEKLVRRDTQKGKVGEAILMLIRRDLQGMVFDGMGRQVFLGENRGDGESAEDRIHFTTTAAVPPPVEGVEEWRLEEITRGICAVGYELGPRRGNEGHTLFRRVRWDLQEGENPLEGGRHFPIYPHVLAFSCRFLDREGVWLDEWKSDERIPEAEEETEDPDLVDPTPTTEQEGEEEVVLDPLPVPLAVEIQLYLLLNDESGILLDPAGKPIVERYSTVVPLLAVEVMDIPPELLEEGAASDLGGGAGPGPGGAGGAGSGGSGSGTGGSGAGAGGRDSGAGGGGTGGNRSGAVRGG